MFQFWLAFTLLPMGLRLQRSFYLLKATRICGRSSRRSQAGSEEGGLVLHFCNKHGIHVSALRGAKEPTVKVCGTQHRILDHPTKKLRFKAGRVRLRSHVWPGLCGGVDPDCVRRERARGAAGHQGVTRSHADGPS